ncbi:MAG: hydroxyphenylacetyl-CoA thioesterase PaaI [Alphaproteobacteria bacterium]|nr:MAG: hydroxyphenylacetyl-CoA thioesterase PaaI [Alphaproteobacteria bacterium]
MTRAEDRHDGEDPQALAEAAAQAMWERDAASQRLGMVIEEIRPGHARLRMRVREDMVNGHAICHGGYIFTLADSAFAFACNSYDVTTVAAHCEISFLAPARLGDDLVAEAEERHRRGRSGIYDVTVRTASGEMIALFRGWSRSIGGSVRAGEAGTPRR